MDERAEDGGLTERLPTKENMMLGRIVSSGQDEENEVNVYGLAYVVFMAFGSRWYYLSSLFSSVLAVKEWHK